MIPIDKISFREKPMPEWRGKMVKAELGFFVDYFLSDDELNAIQDKADCMAFLKERMTRQIWAMAYSELMPSFYQLSIYAKRNGSPQELNEICKLIENLARMLTCPLKADQ